MHNLIQFFEGHTLLEWHNLIGCTKSPTHMASYYAITLTDMDRRSFFQMLCNVKSTNPRFKTFRGQNQNDSKLEECKLQISLIDLSVHTLKMTPNSSVNCYMRSTL